MQNVLIFSDIETDDAICIRLVEKLLKPTKITLVVGEANVDVKLRVGEALAASNPELYTVLPGMPSEREYPTAKLGDMLSGAMLARPYNEAAVIQAIRESTHVICIKPPRELLAMDAELLGTDAHHVFPDVEFWMTGSFNLRSMWKDVERAVIPDILQRMFPKRVVWIESFTAIGEANGVDAMDIKDPVINVIRENWNSFIVDDAAEGVLEHAKSIVQDVEHQGKKLKECEKAYNGLNRNLKCFMNTLGNPQQFLLADQLVPVIMSKGDAWLTPAKYMGYGGTSYPRLQENPEEVGSPPTTLYICSQFKKELREATIAACKEL